MNAIDVGRILGAVNKRLVEHERLAVTPDALHAVDQDSALVRIGRNEAQMIAQRAGKGIAMRAELAAGRQHGEHRAVHRRYRIQEFDRLRA